MFKFPKIHIARKGNTCSSVVMVSSSGLPVACLLVAGSPKSFNLEERILHLPTTTLHRDQVPCISTKPTEGDSGPRVGVMSALTETNKVRGNIRENPIDVSLRAEDELHSSATEHLKPRPSGLTVTGGATCASPAAEPPPTYGTNENEEQSEAEEEEVDGKDIKAPLDLVIEFLGAVMDRDVQLASRLCQMILLHEPDNPEARQFLPLIQEKLLEEHEMERSTEDDDDDNDSGSDEESSSSSPSSSPSEEEEEG